MTCQHRHLSAIPGGRYACTDDPTCRCTFTVTTDGEVERLRARITEGEELIREGITVVDDLMESVDTLTAQRDAARDAARILERALAATPRRLNVEKWGLNV